MPFASHLQLMYLNLGGNCLSVVPECLAALTALQTLHLFRNAITSLPDSLPSQFMLR